MTREQWRKEYEAGEIRDLEVFQGDAALGSDGFHGHSLRSVGKRHAPAGRSAHPVGWRKRHRCPHGQRSPERCDGELAGGMEQAPRQPETLAAGMVLTRSATHAGRFSQRRAGVMRKWESEASRLMDEKNPAIAGLWRLGKPWGSGRFAAQDMLLPQGESLVWWQLGQNDDGCFLPCAQRRALRDLLSAALDH